MTRRISRRDLLLQSAGAVSVLALGAAAAGAAGCNRRPLLVCSDTSSLTPAELEIRNTLAYVDQSPDPTRTCSGCQHFVSRGPHACGECKVLKGPVHPFGSCKSFVAKGAEGGAPA